MTPPLTPAERAAELYPAGPISVPDPMFEGRTLMKWREPVEERAAYIRGHADGKAEGDAARATTHSAMVFFASVIKSGEPWTDECERAYRRALAAGKEQP